MIRWLLILLWLPLSLAGQAPPTTVLLGSSLLNEVHPAPPPGEALIVTAIPDFTSKQLSWVLDHSVVNHAPARVVILGGGEDFLLGIAPARVVTHLMAIADTLAGQGIAPLLGAIVPHHHAVVPAAFAEANAALAQACARRGYAFIDLRPQLAPGGLLDPAFTDDGFHLNAQGRARLTRCLEAVLAGEALPAPLPPEAGPLAQSLDLAYLSRHRVARILASAPATTHLAMLGNSITEQGDWAALLGRDDVRNCGQGGYTTGQFLWHLDTTVIAARPRHCLIMGGINDLAVGVAPDQIYANLATILRRLQAAGIQPVLQATLYPQDDPAIQAILTALNDRLAALAAAEGVPFLDLNQTLSGEQGLFPAYTTDGVHLTPAGYAAWGRLLRQAGWGPPLPEPRYLLDADTGNELDDLYAITLALAPGGLPLQGLASAHFNNAQLLTDSLWHIYPTEGIQTLAISQALNEALIGALGRADLPALRGCDRMLGYAWGFYPGAPIPRSEATDFLIRRARAARPTDKLAVVCLGTPTNVAAALAAAPDIAPHLRVYLLGAQYDAKRKVWNKSEFNIRNDLNAFDLLLNNPEVELWVMPISTARPLTFDRAGTQARLAGREGALYDLLHRRWDEVRAGDSWIMWDLALVAAILRPDLAQVRRVAAPPENGGRKIWVYTQIDVPAMRALFWEAFAAWEAQR